MKLTNLILVLTLSGIALAQAPATKSNAAAPAKPATATAAPATQTKAAAKPAKHASKKTTAAKPAAKEQAKAAPASDAKQADEKKAESAAHRRDPFVSVVSTRESGPACSGGGKKCLIVDQVLLQGIVRGPSGPIAVIRTLGDKTYFLRENDPVYNGVVVKISPDSIIFRETVTDRLGKTSQREVVKKLNNPAA